MDARLARGLKPEGQEELKLWMVNNRHRLELFTDILSKSVATANNHSDKAETFAGPNALAELAHAAGYRQGLREAIALLTNR